MPSPPPLRIVFAGTPEFAIPPLEALIGSGMPPIAVYTQPDRPAGRGRRLTASPVKGTALAYGLPVYQPQTLRKPEPLEELRGLHADLMLVAAYGLILPQGALDAPRLGCVNVHASLLPRWRGAAPIQHAILAGDEASGVTIMRMEAGLDTGPMYLVKRVPLEARETGRSLHDKLAILGASALLEAMPGILDGSLTAKPQDDVRATYARKLTKEEAELDWSRTAVELDRMVRALNPWPVAQTRLQGVPLRLWESEPCPGEPSTAAPGTVIATGKAGIDVATGGGVLRITRLQPPGKRPMSAAELLNARKLGGELLG
ncbi:MAG: methionyl-tRNA formyltransferase [Chromatiaceae bacterium]